MDAPSSHSSPPPWLGLLNWVPVLAYFLIKYLVIGRDQITRQQNWMLIGAVILAEIALWQYRKQFRKPQPPADNGTPQE
ncbi:hypothetical protein QWY85_14665 [Neolewinella lacunae]|uniref:Uncharacterized protein n=1 Tax=Neolewinella lacunae TaxID=1517758 RepID=A0A923PGY1_9BACT|nr:hypothetical protein [Neolewinella lacunae]MBC6993089.1 hypothetical protein [Neolewinella lacunae]MDN3635909.1 hypothetical protein [Neolewinella lacunae]